MESRSAAEQSPNRRQVLQAAVGAVALGATAVVGTAESDKRGAARKQPQGTPEETRAHAAKLHKDSVVVVIHDHNPIEPDIPLMTTGGVTAKVYQIGLDVDIGPDYLLTAPIREGWSRRALAELDDVDRIAAEHKDRLLIAKTAEDVRRAKREGKIAIILGVEGAKLLDGRVDMIEKYYARGLREMQIRWGVPNQIVEDQILTPFGRKVIAECNRLGIIVGLTHIPKPAFYQAIEMVRKPPIVCHGIASRKNDDPPDLLGDKALKALTAVRGVIGLHFYSAYLGRKPGVKQVIEQVDYITNLVGIETVSLGIDFFPTTGMWKAFQYAQKTPEVSWAVPDLSHLGRITEGLVARGYSDSDIQKVLGENFLRVMKANIGS